MSIFIIIGIFLVTLLLIYLIYALLNAEDF
ncbi:K(+)-transporting ATPase subunit F [Xenorhabdus nematophila]|nr:K(+)-transporting ATPase subunit F [Xenorhabdus nematophila]AYA39674.1 K(+)-transporting ATPase subunit F [Xenorhabdus nematophila]MBA0018244.1 K(+)-transporting ATPase subunit F [Xenorhabdus nematophila]MCB4424329.1 K(+)-transporting ATPase subunit F [Xenorhabdus nematophila]QNJ37324.1 K(+)-transporting ATPase subunit F [Xenorhabdus nematophila]